MSNHVIDRLEGRLTPQDRQAAIDRMHYLEDVVLGKRQSVACVLGHNTGASRSSDGSNGRLIVAIWRGRWVTAMLRREGQGLDPNELRVERVIA